jgi:hypothetical protein
MNNRYRLLSINPFPAVCSACGRECPERHWVAVDSSGKTHKFGVSCAWTIAGIKPTDRPVPIEVEVTEADRAESLDFLMSWMNGA